MGKVATYAIGGFAHGVAVFADGETDEGRGDVIGGEEKDGERDSGHLGARGELDAKVDVREAGGGDVAGEKVAAVGVVRGESGVFEGASEGSGVGGHDGGVFVGDDATARRGFVGGDFIQSRGDAELKRRRGGV